MTLPSLDTAIPLGLNGLSDFWVVLPLNVHKYAVFSCKAMSHFLLFLKLFSKSSNVLFYFRNAVYNLFSLVNNSFLIFSNFSSFFVSIRFISFSSEIRRWLIFSIADTWQTNSEECSSYKVLKSFKSCFWCSELTHFAHTRSLHGQ